MRFEESNTRAGRGGGGGGGGLCSSLPRGGASAHQPHSLSLPPPPLSGVKAAASEGAAGGSVTASVDAAADSAGLLELNAETFWPFIKETAGPALVVVDFFTTWCGPCKLMMPKLAAMSAARGGKMIAVKFECNAANKEIGKELGIKSVPTFQLWKVRRGGARWREKREEKRGMDGDGGRRGVSFPLPLCAALTLSSSLLPPLPLFIRTARSWRS